MQRKQLIVGLLMVTTACGNADRDRVSRPQTKDVQGRAAKTAKGEILVMAHYSGGAAGDKTYKLVACTLGQSECEVLTTIDSYDDPPPDLGLDNGSFVLIVNRRDSITAFKNYSEDLQTDRGGILLRYR